MAGVSIINPARKVIGAAYMVGLVCQPPGTETHICLLCEEPSNDVLPHLMTDAHVVKYLEVHFPEFYAELQRVGFASCLLERTRILTAICNAIDIGAALHPTIPDQIFHYDFFKANMPMLCEDIRQRSHFGAQHMPSSKETLFAAAFANGLVPENPGMILESMDDSRRLKNHMDVIEERVSAHEEGSMRKYPRSDPNEVRAFVASCMMDFPED